MIRPSTSCDEDQRTNMSDAEDKKYGPLTGDLVREALRKDKGEAIELVSWRCENFTKKGDNYACFVTSVKVEYKEKDQEERRQVSYVAKTTHRGIGSMSEMMNEVFQKEGTSFDEILPAVNKALEEVHMDTIRTAKGYSASYTLGKEVLMVEDLRPRHFKMFDRRRGMDVPHATLVLKELGRLHAATLSLEKKMGCTLTEKWPVLIEKWLTEDNTGVGEMFQRMIESQMETAAMVMETPKYRHVAAWIKESKASGMDTFRDALGQGGKFAALTHGDCWSNNLLFRYDEAGTPVEVMLVDLQCMRRASVAADLSYFLYSSFTGDVRRNNLDTFLDTYYDSFCGVLQAAQTSPPFSREELGQEFMNKLTFGCICGIILAPIVLCEEDDMMNLFEVNENMYIDRQEIVIRMSSRKDGILRNRYLNMFGDVVRAGLVPNAPAAH